MLIVHGLSLYFGDRCLLSDGALQIAAGERVALLGDNGSGKSTLLRVLAGDLGAVRSGTIQRRGMTRIAYLEQDNAGHDDLSSGQRMRRRLSEALSAMPELLLLDEPTNHLDESGLAWLERALLGFGGAVLFACHDRAFIDAVATRVLLLERGRLSAYRGGYEDFARQRAAERSAQQHRHEEWRRERERLRASAERQRRWADKAHHAAGERNPVGKKRAAKLMHKAIAAEARVGRWESVREPKPYEETPLAFDFLPPSDLPSVLLRAADLTFTYRGASAPALGPVSLDLRRGERLALVGDNGSGKTTLLQAIATAGGAGDDADGDRRGVLRVHPNARIFFLRQDDAPAEGGTALGELLAAGAPDAASARTLLGHFQLRGETALQPVSQLSPGEKIPPNDSPNTHTTRPQATLASPASRDHGPCTATSSQAPSPI